MIHSLFLAMQEHGAEHAAAEDAHGAAVHVEVFAPANWLPGLTALIVFGIAFGVLAIYVWPKITKALDDRDRKIRDEIRSAEEAREQAKRALADYERELASAREEASRMIQKAKSEAKAVSEELRRRNETELTEMRDRARRDIESAKASAIGEIHAEAAGLATSIAAKILRREVSVEDQQRLVDESLTQLAGMRE